MRRRPGSPLFLVLAATLLAPALLPTRAAAQAPSGGTLASGLPGADVFDIRYYLTNAKGDRGRTMDTQDFSYFVNKARCECGLRIETQIRLKVTPGKSYSQDKLLETYIGSNCANAEANPQGQFRKCVQVSAQPVPGYVSGLVSKFHPLWLATGITSTSLSRLPDSPDTIAAASCESGAQGESGVWMCAPLANGMSFCQIDDFFISGNVNSNLPGTTSGVKFDFVPPATLPESISAEPGDGAVVVSWGLGQPGDIFGFRVLCEEADTGKPPPGKGMEAPALDVRSNGSYYFTKDNLCPDGPFSSINISPDAPVASTSATSTTTTTTTGVDTDATGDTGGIDTDTGGIDTDTGGIDTAVCGDGVVGGAEACDDANLVDHDDCRNDCTAPVCGDGIRTIGLTLTEACDLGVNNGPTSLCLANCTLAPALCGDGTVQVGEGCDNVDANVCVNCSPVSCGDGVVQAPEVCDDPADPNCSPRCTTTVCGDGLLSSGEACDSGAANSDAGACTSTCAVAVCGDGLIHSEVGDPALAEQCDDGPDNGDDKACLSNCVRNTCGDGKIGPGEECDDGTANNGDDQACLSTCALNVCGDGKLGPNEACDNGSDNGDGKLCRADCTRQSSIGLENMDWAYVCTPHLSQQTRTTRIDGLENGKRYNFMLVTYDRAGNPRPFTQVVEGTPLDTRDLWEQCKAQGEVCGESGFCNVAGRSDNLLALGGLLGLGLGLGGLRRRSRRKRA